MHEQIVHGIPERRNLGAYAALWLVVTSWVALFLRFAGGTIGSFTTPLDVIYLLALGGGFLCAAVALARIRARGEATLAIAVFAFSLVLPMLYALYFFFVAAVLGDGGFGPAD